MSFDDRLWDGSDPTYSPCTGLSSGLLYWKAPAKYRKAGYSIKTQRLPGFPGDGNDIPRAAFARDLTSAMVRWYEGEEKKIEPGTWGSLIVKYKGDDISPFQDIRPNSRENYMTYIARWEGAIGHLKIADMTFADTKRWQRAMVEKGRSVDYIHKMFTHLRIIVGYGVALRLVGARDAQEILGELRIKSPKPRTSSPSEDQVLSIIAEADKAGFSGFALGALLQWRLTLRAMDIRGDYFRLRKDEERSGIVRGGFRWENGLTWDMFDRDIETLTKTPSKTKDKLPDEIVFDMSLVPDVRARLLGIPVEKRVGPVIVDRHGMPYSRYTWADIFRKCRAFAKVPTTVWMMDIRAGAINDAKNKGASRIELQQQANHASGETTERYIREKSDGANNVLRLRGTNMKQV